MNRELVSRASSVSLRKRRWMGRMAVCLGAASLTCAAINPAWSQAFPTKPVRIVVPFGAGSVLDSLARLLSEPLGKTLGQPVIVENVPGAGGVTGTQQVVRAARDGHTIALTNNSHVINPSIYKNLDFDSLKDITPIAVLGNTPLVLVVNPKLPANNVRELIAIAKSKPGALTYGSSGNGSVVHLAGVLLNSEAGTDIKHVPYKQAAQMLTDLLGGTIDMVVYSIPPVAAHIQSGKLRAVGVSTQVRSTVIPSVPTLAEQGLSNYDFGGWLAIIGPSGIPRPVVTRLNSEIKAAMALKETQAALVKLGVTPMDNSLEFANSYLASELEKHTKLVKSSGATLE